MFQILKGCLNQKVALCVSVECQRLKARVVQEIRANQDMEREVDSMDIKIGLLVKNRIDLEVGLWVGGCMWVCHACMCVGGGGVYYSCVNLWQ